MKAAWMCDAIDHAIDAHQYNRATTLTYTCLEGLYIAYIRMHDPEQVGLPDLMPLCKVVKGDICEKLQSARTVPHRDRQCDADRNQAVANSRNGFSESHFNVDSQQWLALFAQDLTNSLGRLLLNFI